MKEFLDGIKKGTPIGFGYLTVSFALGVMAVKGFTPLQSIILSVTNLTSAGQFAGYKMVIAAAGYLEIGITILLINLRYCLMSTSISQKLTPDIPLWKKLIFGYALTDEIFGVAVTEKKPLTAEYMFGIMIAPIIGWGTGTALGAFGSNIFPERLLDAFGVAFYAMFVAIIVPEAKRNYKILIVILIAIAISCMFEYVPVINTIGLGFKIVITTIVAALLGALLFPVKTNEEEEKDV